MLSRTGAYKPAAGLTIAAFPLIIFTAIVNYPVTGLQTTVQYLVLSVFLASIFLSWRGLAVLAITISLACCSCQSCCPRRSRPTRRL